MSDINQEAGWYFDAYFKGKGLLHAFHKKRIDTICGLVPDGKDILDCGCGSGILACLLSGKAKSIAGVDTRKECVDFCNTHIMGTFRQEDLLNLDLKRTYDVVICADVIEHFNAEDRETVLKNLDKHVAEGGRLILSFPSSLYLALEPLWINMRRLAYPGKKFDDEEIHLSVNVNALHLSNYRVVKRGFACWGLIGYIALEKSHCR